MPDARPGRDHILVSGLGKTGTSGVYTSIKTGLARAGFDHRTYFEPRGATLLIEQFRQAPHVPVMTKIILQALRKMDLPPQAFDRRVMTVRDPRDTAISGLLFRPLIEKSVHGRSDAEIGEFVAALEQKERDPASVSVVDLYRLTAKLHMGSQPENLMREILVLQQQMIDEGGFHIVRYEDFVRGELDDLSDYLGFPVENVSTRTSNVYGHISRSEGTGSFRDWFTKTDLDFFNERWGSYMERVGFPIDVELTESPVINPAESSEYVRSRFQARRDSLLTRRENLSRANAGDEDAPAVFAALVERSQDGDRTASLQAARLAVSGGLGGRREQDAIELARLAAEAGSVPAMKVLIGLLKSAQEPELIRERLGWRQEVKARQRDSTADVEAELAKVKKSTSYRVGNAMVRAARSPRTEGRGAGRELVTLWRRRRAR